MAGLPKKAKAIIVDPKLCKGCHICISVCPHNAIESSKEVDNRGFYLPVIRDLEACRVCRLCEMHCPDFAISIEEE